MNSKIRNVSNMSILENYVSFIKARNYRNNLNYITPIKEFLCWLEGCGLRHVKEITATDINLYSEWLHTRPCWRGEGTLSDNSVKNHLLALHLFFEMLLDTKVVSAAYVLPAFSKRKSIPREILSISEVLELKRCCENKLETSIINIAYGCGLRRTEMVMLNVHDVLLSKGYLVVRSGKNGKRREIPLTETISAEIKNYIFSFRQQRVVFSVPLENAFFLNSNGQRISGGSLNKMLKTICSRSGNRNITAKNITLHCLRHSIATHLQEAGAGMEFVRDFLGHTEIDTTQLYMIRRRKQFKIA
ncbi:MAG: hypothetical protein A2W93_00700 [Bacteroidetes bacterium GWF2_43_63]|nr:MAG: hypothetical protein A2W94_10950 [Bacteroidetes bacterium GWE2_42_42]OFY54979.1 MAG: hypothetical protein A2W93_00700 [Bacteroidetes bacterium GWF2_43_63]HBG69513.1 integrase [Bacteroidales bacterium]HCB61320.1 integrase [Bacteroidales bacterium]